MQVKTLLYRALLSPLHFAVFKQQQALEAAMFKCRTSSSPENMTLPHLRDFDEILKEHDSQNLLFFLETSDASQLTVRQSCALESAAKFSGRVVLLLMTSPVGQLLFLSFFLLINFFLLFLINFLTYC